MLKRVVLLCLFMGFSMVSFAQDSYRISGTVNKTLQQFITDSEKQFGFLAFYQSSWLQDLFVSGDFDNVRLLDVLNQSMQRAKIQAYFFDAKTLIFIPASDFKSSAQIAQKIDPNQTISVGTTSLSTGQTANLKGFVLDGKTSQPIPGVAIYAMDYDIGAFSNEDGFYTIKVPLGKQRMRYSFVGYENAVVTLDIQSDGTFSMDMFDAVTELSTVTVTSEAPDENIRSVDMGIETLNIQQVKRLPVLMGEVDVIKSLILLPGVSTVGEGAGGFNVRGGSVGENLVLQDGSEIFNSSHLFGFFSTFNPDMVEELTLYKAGGIQADQGGRLSSILDVRMKEGDKREFHGRGGIGSLMTRLSLEAPIVKDKVSLSVGGRLTYSDWLLRQFDDIDLKQSEAGFADANAKLSLELSPKDRLNISGYWSEDRFKLANDTLFTYGTALGSISWNHAFTDRLVTSTHANLGQYKSNVKDEIGPNQFELDAKIDYASLTQDFDFQANEQHNLKIGGKVNLYDVHQGDLQPLDGSVNTDPITIPNERGIEIAAYLADQWTINDRLSMNFGVRWSYFNNVGPRDVYLYEEGLPKSPITIIDTVSYGDGTSIQKYSGFEPRVGLRYQIDNQSSVKGGYNRMRQYLHLVSNTAAITPVDVWQLSNTYIRPAISDQWAIGYFRNFNNNTIEASVEVYYKKTHDILDYKGGANLLLNPTLESDLLQGQGRARGVEFLFKKKEGKAKGWLSYTYSRTEIKAVSEFSDETVNEGEYYPANYDKPHNLSAVFSYDFTKRITFTANFNFSTGRPITIPTSIYRIGPFNSFPDYSKRNEYRIPDYHRLDISLSIDQGFSKLKKVKGEWNFSIYNVYNRMNAYSIYFTEIGRAYKLSILGIIPSVSYNFIF